MRNRRSSFYALLAVSIISTLSALELKRENDSLRKVVAEQKTQLRKERDKGNIVTRSTEFVWQYIRDRLPVTNELSLL